MDVKFKLNQVVSIHAREYPNHGMGRVWYHDKRNQIVYVLLRTGTFVWRVKKYDELSVTPVIDYSIWGTDEAFAIK